MITISSQYLLWIIPLVIWDLAWKGLALWRAGSNKQPAWFVFILIINSVGILPIIYLLIQNNKAKVSKDS